MNFIDWGPKNIITYYHSQPLAHYLEGKLIIKEVPLIYLPYIENYRIMDAKWIWRGILVYSHASREDHTKHLFYFERPLWKKNPLFLFVCLTSFSSRRFLLKPNINLIFFYSVIRRIIINKNWPIYLFFFSSLLFPLFFFFNKESMVIAEKTKKREKLSIMLKYNLLIAFHVYMYVFTYILTFYWCITCIEKSTQIIHSLMNNSKWIYHCNHFGQEIDPLIPPPNH